MSCEKTALMFSAKCENTTCVHQDNTRASFRCELSQHFSHHEYLSGVPLMQSCLGNSFKGLPNVVVYIFSSISMCKQSVSYISGPLGIHGSSSYSCELYSPLYPHYLLYGSFSSLSLISGTYPPLYIYFLVKFSHS